MTTKTKEYVGKATIGVAQVPKKKGKNEVEKKPRGDGWKYSPLISTNGMDLAPGDNTTYLMINMELFRLPRIDMHDPRQVEERLQEYFAIYAKYDVKPTLAGMGVALNGMSRATLWAVANDQPTGSNGGLDVLPRESSDSIKRAYNLLSNLYENYMLNGKINPVAGIFMGKNNYGYKDKTETVITPNVNEQDRYNAATIRQKYLTDSEESD